ncbi:hypothetical protein HW555_009705 [Spodoptera exigua]|uniref:Uncharacterized protein n=1 Tax=Spodoptera exigua TaxID=7107 RepID=A0A835GAI7_SPOEX|nr:hypothetical protein HW555_009705 [Spodoptera exigua]
MPGGEQTARDVLGVVGGERGGQLVRGGEARGQQHGARGAARRHLQRQLAQRRARARRREALALHKRRPQPRVRGGRLRTVPRTGRYDVGEYIQSILGAFWCLRELCQ